MTISEHASFFHYNYSTVAVAAAGDENFDSVGRTLTGGTFNRQ
ncbi:MAG: hypothetical protein ABJX82_00125 [Paracoccaceae bacterium]